MAGLGKYSMGSYGRIGVYRVNYILKAWFPISFETLNTLERESLRLVNTFDIYTLHDLSNKFQSREFSLLKRVKTLHTLHACLQMRCL